MSLAKHVLLRTDINWFYQTSNPNVFTADTTVHIGLYEFATSYTQLNIYSLESVSLMQRLPVSVATGNTADVREAINTFYKHTLQVNLYSSLTGGCKTKLFPRVDSVFPYMTPSVLNLKKAPPLTDLQLEELMKDVEEYYSVIGRLPILYELGGKQELKSAVLNSDEITKRILYDLIRGELNYYHGKDYM